jgi:serine/threonine protein kinase
VRCRRIRLARKSMRYRRGTKLEDLVEEVAHLHRLRHAHIIQLVGSYLQKDKFAILLYPAAHYDLSEFMERENIFFNSSLSESIAQSLSRFFLCLAHAIDYVHGQGVKHMDIKPTNILVFRPRGSHSRTVLLYDTIPTTPTLKLTEVVPTSELAKDLCLLMILRQMARRELLGVGVVRRPQPRCLEAEHLIFFRWDVSLSRCLPC